MAEDQGKNDQQALQDYYQQMYQTVMADYVGPGKSFRDKASFDKYIGGMGQGFVETFGGGSINDSDERIRRLSNLGRAAYGGHKGAGTTAMLQTLMKEDPNFPDFYKKYAAGATAESDGPSDQTDYDNWRKQALQRLDDTSKKMNMSVDQLIASGDGGAINTQNTAQRTAGMQAYAAGSGLGGVSNANTQKVVADSLNNYQMQRSQLGLQATQSLMGGLQNQYMNAEDRFRYEQGMNLQLQNAEATASAYKAQREAQMWQAAGSILGGVGGGLGSMAGGGSFSSGYGMGSQLGGGLGNIVGSSQYQPYQYQYPSGRRPSSSSGGLGGTQRYGGAQ